MCTSLSESESENLYRVTMQGKWEEVVKIYEKNPKAHKMRITHEGGTALHLAVIECKEDTVFKLVQEICKIDKSALEIQNDRDDTPLHHAASAGSKIMCKYIVEAANPRLIGVRTSTERLLYSFQLLMETGKLSSISIPCALTSLSLRVCPIVISTLIPGDPTMVTIFCMLQSITGTLMPSKALLITLVYGRDSFINVLL
nr:uncharacterized protein LOC125420573 [Ziziphus jujuba var. spinosa]